MTSSTEVGAVPPTQLASIAQSVDSDPSQVTIKPGLITQLILFSLSIEPAAIISVALILFESLTST